MKTYSHKTPACPESKSERKGKTKELNQVKLIYMYFKPL